MATIDINQVLALSLLDIAPPEPTAVNARSDPRESFNDYLQRARTSSADSGNNGNSFPENNSRPSSAPKSDDTRPPIENPSFRDKCDDGNNTESAQNSNPPEMDQQQPEHKAEPTAREEAAPQAKKEEENKDKNKNDGDDPVMGEITGIQPKVQLNPEAAQTKLQSALGEDASSTKEEIKNDSNLLQDLAKNKTAVIDPGAAKATGTLTTKTSQIAGKQTESPVSTSPDEKASKNDKKIGVPLAEKQPGEDNLTPGKGESHHAKTSKDMTDSPHDSENNISHHNEKKGSSAAQIIDAPIVPAVSQDTSAAATPVNSAVVQAVVNVPVVSPKQADAKIEIQKTNTASNDKTDIAANSTMRVGSAASKAAAAMSQGSGDEAGSQFNRVRFVQRVEQAFAAIGERGGSLRLKLSPPELGSLRLDITVRKGVMKARIEAETSQAKNLLLENLPALRDRLAQQDIKIQQFDVNLRDPSSGGMSQQTAQQADAETGNGGYRNPRARVQEKIPAAMPTAGNAQIANHNGQLNVIV